MPPRSTLLLTPPLDDLGDMADPAEADHPRGEVCPEDAGPDGPPMSGVSMDRASLVAALCARIARLDGSLGRGADPGAAAFPLCPAIDRALPAGGLARAAVHEVLAADADAAAGFCAMVLARSRGTVLWIGLGLSGEEVWPPGLARFGLSPADLVLVQAPRREDALWAMEESLRCPAVAGALLAIDRLDMTAARRLQLAAEAGGALGLLLRPEAAAEEARGGVIAALTRWRVAALPGSGARDLGDPRWQLDLLRGRGARSGGWAVTWRLAAEQLDLDAGEDDRGGEGTMSAFAESLPDSGRVRASAAGRRRR